MKNCILILIFILHINLVAETSTHLDENVDYDFQLIKFYLNKEEYNLIIDHINSIEKETFITDSLKYFRAKAYVGLENWEEASTLFSNILKTSKNEKLSLTVIEELKEVLDHFDAMISIEKISNTLDDMKNDNLRPELLFILAEIYEENQLFSEANDVYKTILKETDFKNKAILNLKMVTNYIFLKEFENAIKTLKPIIALNDSLLNEDALFFNYIANHSLNKFKKAKESLLKLYIDYPNHRNKAEIIHGLAELYVLEQQYLISWYLLNELYEISSQAQKIAIYEEIKIIKELIVHDSLTVDQFKNFKPVFDEFEDGE